MEIDDKKTLWIIPEELKGEAIRDEPQEVSAYPPLDVA
jgi:hypothetical protein